MLSRKKALKRRKAKDGEQLKQGVWHELGNFNSNLSTLTWTAQLILFDFQMVEMSFGYILQWRLYLFAASRTAIAKNQAHSLLYDKLLFSANDIIPIEVWRLYDNLDFDDYGGSWLTDERNAEILSSIQPALLRYIEQRAELQEAYAMACYEAHAPELLSVTYINIGHRRCVLIWEKTVMVYV
ncbi:hypothetical protein B0J13DRAFT_588948 [Dactylonectria estremocensis]|uniref:Uncharacterized protein n=1 Tax=Dactylonectria estremocensis TaxID=1079267 RepID=A0A9P9IPH0_9HYPO|nr:hypothetical protein B0J13DRAFT_588948 [Dactylonectria estremocensis]